MVVRFFYNLGFKLAVPFILLRLFARSLKGEPLYRRGLSERLGFPNYQKNKPVIWLHAVSMGEVKAALPLIKILQEKYPQYAIVITTSTATGMKTLAEQFTGQISYFYLPLDYAGAIKRFLKKIAPKIIIIMETEIWPNLLYYAYQAKVPVMLANARLSPKSAGGYKKLKFFIKKIISLFTFIGAQSSDDAKRFVEIGANPQQVQVLGNIKFDLHLNEKLQSKAASLKKFLNLRCQAPRKIIIAASTHEQEEQMVVSAFKKAYEKDPQLLLILVPRHPQRFEKVFKICQAQHCEVIKHTDKLSPSDKTMVYLVNTTGELLKFYGAADLAFVGGSLVPVGGHNILEAAAWGVPTLIGPYVYNFQAIVNKMLAEQACLQISEVSELEAQFLEWIHNPQKFSELGARGQEWLAQNRGALDNHVLWIDRALNC